MGARTQKSPKSIRLHRTVAAAVLLASCGASWWIWTEIDIHENLSANAGLVVENRYLNFGQVWEQSRFRWKVPITNSGSEEVQVMGFSATCSCLAVEPPAFAMQPGESREVELTFDLTRRGKELVGDWERSFEVRLFPQVQAAAARPAGWTFTGNVKVPIVLSPPILEFGEKPLFHGQSAAPQEVRVSCATPLDSLICRWDIPKGQIPKGKAEVTNVANGSEFVVKVTPSNFLLPGLYSEKIELLPVFPGRRDVPPVTLSCKINVLPDIATQPANLVLFAAENRPVPQGTVRVASRSGRRVSRCVAEEQPRTGPKGVITLACLGKEDDNTFMYRVSVESVDTGIHSTSIRFGLFLDGHEAPSEVRIDVIFGKTPVPHRQSGRGNQSEHAN